VRRSTAGGPARQGLGRITASHCSFVHSLYTRCTKRLGASFLKPQRDWTPGPASSTARAGPTWWASLRSSTHRFTVDKLGGSFPLSYRIHSLIPPYSPPLYIIRHSNILRQGKLRAPARADPDKHLLAIYYSLEQLAARSYRFPECASFCHTILAGPPRAVSLCLIVYLSYSPIQPSIE
jgi:hypothetical protein